LGGSIVEEGPANQIITAPQHPYTESLINTASHLHLWGASDRLHHVHPH